MNLTKYPLEDESKEILYTRLMEECSELAIEAMTISKACSKSLRFGFKKGDYETIEKTLNKLEAEMSDVQVIAKEVRKRAK